MSLPAVAGSAEEQQVPPAHRFKRKSLFTRVWLEQGAALGQLLLRALVLLVLAHPGCLGCSSITSNFTRAMATVHRLV